MKTHIFNGVRYTINLSGEVDGVTDNPKKGPPTLMICTKLSSQMGLETAIHEGLHACSFLQSEERVQQTAKDISRFLWRLGFRVRKTR